MMKEFNRLFHEMDNLFKGNDKLFEEVKIIFDKLAAEKRQEHSCCCCKKEPIKRPKKPVLTVKEMARKLSKMAGELDTLSKDIYDSVEYDEFPDNKAEELSKKLEKQLIKIKLAHPHGCMDGRVFLKKVLVYCLLRTISDSKFTDECLKKIAAKFKSFRDFGSIDSDLFGKELSQTLEEINHEFVGLIGHQIRVNCREHPFCVDVTAYIQDSPFFKIEFNGEDKFMGRARVSIWVSRKGIYDGLETKPLDNIEKALKSLKDTYYYLWNKANPTE